MSERKLDIAKRIIKEYYDEARCGIFDSRNIVGDSMNRIYDDGELSIDICHDWSYFEVLGFLMMTLLSCRSFMIVLILLEDQKQIMEKAADLLEQLAEEKYDRLHPARDRRGHRSRHHRHDVPGIHRSYRHRVPGRGPDPSGKLTQPAHAGGLNPAPYERGGPDR